MSSEVIKNVEEFAKILQQKANKRIIKRRRTNDYDTLRDSLAMDEKVSTRTSTYSGKINMNEEKHTKNNSIKLDINISKQREPKLIKKSFKKLSQKFNNKNILQAGKFILTNDISNVDIEELETYEQISIDKLLIIESKKIIDLKNEFPFQLLVELEKIYEETFNDFKLTELGNTPFKQKIGAQYLDNFRNDTNPVSIIFQHNNNASQFITMELCLFSALLCFDIIYDIIKDNSLLSLNCLNLFKTCFKLAHNNYMFIVFLVINNTKNISDENNKIFYDMCVNIISTSSDEYNMNTYRQKFEDNNNLLKKSFKKLLKYLNSSKLVDIINIFNSRKTKSLNQIKTDILSNDSILKRFEIQSKEFYDERENHFEEDEEQEILPIPAVPYLKPKKSSDKREYTLVLDLDETLVHYFDGEEDDSPYVKVRRYAEDFINKLSDYCEIVIFTASLKDVYYI